MAAIVFLPWIWPKAGVTGTLRPESTICMANGATSGSGDRAASFSSAVVPGK